MVGFHDQVNNRQCDVVAAIEDVSYSLAGMCEQQLQCAALKLKPFKCTAFDGKHFGIIVHQQNAKGLAGPISRRLLGQSYSG